VLTNLTTCRTLGQQRPPRMSFKERLECRAKDWAGHGSLVVESSVKGILRVRRGGNCGRRRSVGVPPAVARASCPRRGRERDAPTTAGKMPALLSSRSRQAGGRGQTPRYPHFLGVVEVQRGGTRASGSFSPLAGSAQQQALFFCEFAQRFVQGNQDQAGHTCKSSQVGVRPLLVGKARVGREGAQCGLHTLTSGK